MCSTSFRVGQSKRPPPFLAPYRLDLFELISTMVRGRVLSAEKQCALNYSLDVHFTGSDFTPSVIADRQPEGSEND